MPDGADAPPRLTAVPLASGGICMHCRTHDAPFSSLRGRPAVSRKRIDRLPADTVGCFRNDGANTYSE